MNNILNKDLIKEVFKKCNLEFDELPGDKITVRHSIEDWDFVSIISMRLGFYSERWMINQQPRTTIHLN